MGARSSGKSEKYEQQAPAAVMTRLAHDRALPAQWIDEVFEHNRQRQYPRELLFSSMVELLTLVTLGLRPSLHAAARKMVDRLPVSLAALYAKVKRTEPGWVASAHHRRQPSARQRQAAGPVAWLS